MRSIKSHFQDSPCWIKVYKYRGASKPSTRATNFSLSWPTHEQSVANSSLPAGLQAAHQLRELGLAHVMWLGDKSQILTDNTNSSITQSNEDLATRATADAIVNAVAKTAWIPAPASVMIGRRGCQLSRCEDLAPPRARSRLSTRHRVCVCWRSRCRLARGRRKNKLTGGTDGEAPTKVLKITVQQRIVYVDSFWPRDEGRE